MKDLGILYFLEMSLCFFFVGGANVVLLGILYILIHVFMEGSGVANTRELMLVGLFTYLLTIFVIVDNFC